MPFDLNDDDFGVPTTDADLDKVGQYDCPPPGRYRVQVVGVEEKVANSGTEGLEFKFVILDPPCEGVEFKDVLWLSEKTKPRKELFLCRLKLKIKDQTGTYRRNPEKRDWLDAIGEEVVAVVVNEEFTRSNGQKGKVAKLEYAGLLDLDDPRAQPLGPTDQAGGAGPAGQATPSKPTPPTRPSGAAATKPQQPARPQQPASKPARADFSDLTRRGQIPSDL